MWDGTDAALVVSGEERQRKVEEAITGYIKREGLQASTSDIARMAVSSMHIADGKCSRDKIHYAPGTLDEIRKELYGKDF